MNKRDRAEVMAHRSVTWFIYDDLVLTAFRIASRLIRSTHLFDGERLICRKSCTRDNLTSVEVDDNSLASMIKMNRMLTWNILLKVTSEEEYQSLRGEIECVSRKISLFLSSLSLQTQS
jgi:hypothetical protein